MGSKDPAAKRAAMEAGKKKEVISDEERVRLIRIEIDSNIYPSSENARALLREYDKEKAAVLHLGPACAGLLARAELAEDKLRMEVQTNNELDTELKRLKGDINILNLQLESAKNGTFTDGKGPWPCNADGAVREATISETLQADLEPLPDVKDNSVSNSIG